MLTNQPVPVKKFITMDTSGEFVNYPKRERFVFRPSHLEVLERYFAEDSYPSQEKRDEIARACNTAVEMQSKRERANDKLNNIRPLLVPRAPLVTFITTLIKHHQSVARIVQD